MDLNCYSMQYYNLCEFMDLYHLGFIKDHPNLHTMYKLACTAIMYYDNNDKSKYEKKCKEFNELKYKSYMLFKGGE